MDRKVTISLSGSGGQQVKDVYQHHVDELIAADPARLERIFRITKHWLGEPGAPVIDLKIERDTLIPWRAAYWKTLPAGHRARFHYTTEPHAKRIVQPRTFSPALRDEMLDLYRWYENPFRDPAPKGS